MAMRRPGAHFDERDDGGSHDRSGAEDDFLGREADITEMSDESGRRA